MPTRANWNPSLHPRDRHGRFIDVFGWVSWLLPHGERKRGQVTKIEDVRGRTVLRVREGESTHYLTPADVDSIPSPKADLDEVGTKSEADYTLAPRLDKDDYKEILDRQHARTISDDRVQAAEQRIGHLMEGGDWADRRGSVNLSGLYAEDAEAIADALTKLHDEYPEAFARRFAGIVPDHALSPGGDFRGLGASPMAMTTSFRSALGGNVYRVGATLSLEKTLFQAQYHRPLDGSYPTGGGPLQRDILSRNAVNTGFLVSDTVEGTIIHEFGHVLSLDARMSVDDDAWKVGAENMHVDEALPHMQYTVGDTIVAVSHEDMGVISGYGNPLRNGGLADEEFAESFAAYQLGYLGSPDKAWLNTHFATMTTSETARRRMWVEAVLDVAKRPDAEGVTPPRSYLPENVGTKANINPEEYRGLHQPDNGGPPAWDITAEGGEWGMPADVYDHPDWYVGDPGSPASKETIRVLREIRGDPEAMVEIYRAAPPEAKKINAGDWVTLSYTYAREHGKDPEDPAKDWPVISRRVRADEVRFAGDDLNEFGWFPDEDPNLPPVDRPDDEARWIRIGELQKDLTEDGKFVHEEEIDRLFAEGRKARNDYDRSIADAIASGYISPEDAKKRWEWMADSATNNTVGMGEWVDLPETLYHVTTNAKAIREDGVLLSRASLQMKGLGNGLGGGSDNSVSFTDSPEVAQQIRTAMIEAAAVANGTINIQSMMDAAEAGTGAETPYLAHMVRYWDYNWNPGDPYPPAVQRMLDGEPGMLKKTGPEERLDFYKIFTSMRELHGGPMDPLFFGSNAEWFASITPDDIEIVEVHPAPGTRGVRMGALGEIRLPGWNGIPVMDESGARSMIDVEDIEDGAEVRGKLSPLIRDATPSYDAPATYMEDERVVLNGFSTPEFYVEARDPDHFPTQVTDEFQSAFVRVQDEVTALAGNLTVKGRHQKRTVNLSEEEELWGPGEANAAVGYYYGTRGDQAHEITLSIMEGGWTPRSSRELAHTFVHEAAHAYFAERDDANIDQYRSLLDALSEGSEPEWEYGRTNGVHEFAPDLIGYAVVNPSVIAREVRRNGQWDPAEIDRMVGEAIDQPDFHSVSAVVAVQEDVGSKAAIRLLPDIEVDQREGESYEAAVRRATEQEVGAKASISFFEPKPQFSVADGMVTATLDGNEVGALRYRDIGRGLVVESVYTDPSVRGGEISYRLTSELLKAEGNRPLILPHFADEVGGQSAVQVITEQTPEQIAQPVPGPDEGLVLKPDQWADRNAVIAWRIINMKKKWEWVLRTNPDYVFNKSDGTPPSFEEFMTTFASDLRERLTQDNLLRTERHDKPIVIRVPEERALDVAVSGYLANQFLTGTSEGSYDPLNRAIREQNLLGKDERGRIVYGALGASNSTSSYGPVMFVLRPEVARRATITFGDSLSEWDGYTAPLPLEGAKDATDAEVVAAFNGDLQDAMLAFLNGHSTTPGWDYVEVQVQGIPFSDEESARDPMGNPVGAVVPLTWVDHIAYRPNYSTEVQAEKDAAALNEVFNYSEIQPLNVSLHTQSSHPIEYEREDIEVGVRSAIEMPVTLPEVLHPIGHLGAIPVAQPGRGMVTDPLVPKTPKKGQKDTGLYTRHPAPEQGFLDYQSQTEEGKAKRLLAVTGGGTGNRGGKKNVELRGVPDFEDVTDDEDVIAQMEHNLRTVIDSIPENEHPENWAQWYPLAHDYIGAQAEANGIDADVGYAVTARLSPQTDWTHNVAMSNVIFMLWRTDPMIDQATLDAAVVNAKAIVSKGKGGSSAEKRIKSLDVGDGMTLKEIAAADPEVAAYLVRLYADTHDISPLTYDWDTHTWVIVHNADGSPSRTRWQSFDNIAPAMEMLANPDYETINMRLGEDEKIRSFYNDMRDNGDPPVEEWGHDYRDVTTDTHHAGAAFGIPMSSSAFEISTSGETNNFTGISILAQPVESKTGGRGAYPLVVEATRRLAAEPDIIEMFGDLSPAQLQSVIWEAWKRMWPDGSIEGYPGIRNEWLTDIVRAIRSNPNMTVAEKDAMVEHIRSKAVGISHSSGALNISAILSGEPAWLAEAWSAEQAHHGAAPPSRRSVATPQPYERKARITS